jgi:cytochrome c oxidase subunit 2
MPAWHEDDGGPLNDEQVTDLVNLIHLGLWEEVVASSIEQYGAVPTAPPLPTPEGGAPDDPLAAQGLSLYQAQCMACHTIDGSDATGPTWQNLYGGEVALEGGETVVADDAYIIESIREPAAKVHQGFGPIMPPFPILTDDEINALIAYMKTISENATE